MPTRLFPLLLALALTSSLARAQESAAEPKADDAPKATRVVSRPTAAPAPAATATPAPRKRSFFGRIFGSRVQPVATPIPVPATPVPKKVRPPVRPRATPTPDDPEGTPTKPAGTDSHDPASATPAPKNLRNPRAGTSSKGAGRDPAPTSDPDKEELATYNKVKAAAAADPKVAELQSPVDNASSEEEGRKALRAYNKALFQKMRSLDSSLEPRIDRMEEKVMKRLAD